MSTSLKDMQEKDRADRANSLKRQMAALELPSRTLLVGAFERDFLPYFSGKEAFTDEARAVWLTVAGNMLSSVALVDSSGTVVATVPPLAVNNVAQPFNPDRRKHADTEATMDRVAKVSTLSPNAGQNALHTGLGKRFAPIAGRKDPNLEKQWGELFKYFGIDMVGVVNEKAAPAGSKASPTIELNFDDL